ncbi:helix-turn-helix transcriptional regulator, partial [Pseudomonas sp. Bc-h]|uniref:helix-turn-helix domain-containing protein n=1 Tax=Pseudomonas sp. Bc-h TaxID=1943632 RepID=UPI00117AAC26
MKSKAALTKRFGKRVREMRRLRNLSQEEFAAVAGLDRSYMGAIERGEQNPSLWIIARIADALEVTVERGEQNPSLWIIARIADALEVTV